jgi:putative sigma-54 modulation protein
MDIIIQSPGFNAGESLENFIREKVGRLKSDKIVRANVTLSMGPLSNPENNCCEIRLEVPGNDHFVKKESIYFETAVSECVEILSQKIKRERDKNLDRRHAEALTIHEAALEANSAETEPELEDVVK